MSRRTPSIVAVLLAFSLLLTACGSKTSTSTGSVAAPTQGSTSTGNTAGTATTDPQCPSSNAKNFAKTRFVLHTAEGFGAFHRYLYKPYKAGAFSKGSSGRIKTFLKAGAAALFIKRQVRLASEDVKANPTLCKAIAAPLAKVGEQISGAVSKLKGGDPSGIEDANTSIDSIKNSAAGKGVAVQEDPNASLTSNG